MTNKQLKLYGSLNQKKYRREHSLFIAEGPHLVEMAVNSSWKIEKIVIKHEKIDFIEKLNLPVKLITVTQSVKFDKISSSKTPQGILAVIKTKNIREDIHRFTKKAKRIVVADNVSDPGNLGAIIRTATAFGYDLIACVGDCAEIYNPKTVRATQGGLFTIPVVEINKPSEFMKLFASQFNLVTFSSNNKKPLSKATRINRPALVFGGEVSGKSPEIEAAASHRFRIEQTENIESLNVSVAAGVAMYKFYRGYWK